MLDPVEESAEIIDFPSNQILEHSVIDFPSNQILEHSVCTLKFSIATIASEFSPRTLVLATPCTLMLAMLGVSAGASSDGAAKAPVTPFNFSSSMSVSMASKFSSFESSPVRLLARPWGSCLCSSKLKMRLANAVNPETNGCCASKCCQHSGHSKSSSSRWNSPD